MQTSKPLAGLLLASAALGSLACGDIAADPIQGRPSALSAPGAESDDPYACELIPTGATTGHTYRDFYTPTCRLTGAPCLADGTGSWVVDPVTQEITGHNELQMVCEHFCQTDSDCPAPESGTAVATCLFLAEPSPENPFGECVVSCGGGETCQDGFECRESRGGTDYATWPSTCVGKPVSLDYTGSLP